MVEYQFRLNDWIASTFFNSTHAVSSHREQLVLLHDWLVVLPPKKCLSVGIITISNGDNNLNNLVMMKLGDEKYILYSNNRCQSKFQRTVRVSKVFHVSKLKRHPTAPSKAFGCTEPVFFGSSRSILAGHYCLRSARKLNSRMLENVDWFNDNPAETCGTHKPISHWCWKMLE